MLKIICIFVLLIPKPFLIRNFNNSPDNSVPTLNGFGYKPLFDGDIILYSMKKIFKNNNISNLLNEVWKDVIGYEGLYSVSNLGRIKSLKRIQIMNQTIDKNGYCTISLCKNGKKKIFKIHRLVAVAFIPNPENKPQVNHKKGIKTDNRASELEWSTIKENFIHASKNNLTNKGKQHGRSKLTEEDVLKIRLLYSKGDISTIKLAKIFNVTQCHISCITRRVNWTHI